MNKVDTSKLKEIANRGPTEKAIMKVLASRERASRNTNLAMFRKDLMGGFKKLLPGSKTKREKNWTVPPLPNFNREAFDQTWIDLEALGIGKVFYTPMGIPAQFEWMGWKAASIGAAALDSRKHPELANLRNRVIKEKKFRQKVIEMPTNRGMSRRAPTELKKGHANPEEGFTRPTFDFSHSALVAQFMTKHFETIELRLNKGLTAEDKSRLAEWVHNLPTRDQ